MKKIVDLPHNKKMIAVVGATSAFFIILAVVIFCCVSGGSPEKPVGTVCFGFYLSDENVNEIVKQNGSGKEYTAKDYFAEIGTAFGNPSAKNSDDVYKAFLNSYSQQYKGNLKNFEIVDSTDISTDSDEVKSAVEGSQRLVKAFYTEKLDTTKYFNSSKVKKAVKLNVRYVKNEKVQNSVWIVVKMGTSWKILSVN